MVVKGQTRLQTLDSGNDSCTNAGRWTALLLPGPCHPGVGAVRPPEHQTRPVGTMFTGTGDARNPAHAGLGALGTYPEHLTLSGPFLCIFSLR